MAKLERDKAKQERHQRKADREARKRLKSRSEWLREAQAAFNAWIRWRDRNKPCVSCGTFSGKINAGHYRSVGSCPQLRFERLNVHRQCERCNTHLSGNLIPYRAELLKRIGPEKLAWLEGPHETEKLTVGQIQAIRAEYKAAVPSTKLQAD